MAGNFPNITPVHAEKIAPEGAEPWGVTPDGRQILRLVTRRTHSVPRIGSDGKQEWALHPTTAQPIYPLRRHEPYDHVEIFTMESDGHCNVYKEPYTPPTAEQIAAESRQKKVAELMPALAGALVDAGLTPDQLVARLSGAQAVEAPEEAAYPIWKGASNWQLSNGETVRGNREKATEAEAALHATETVPTY